MCSPQAMQSPEQSETPGQPHESLTVGVVLATKSVLSSFVDHSCIGLSHSIYLLLDIGKGCLRRLL